VSLKVKSVPPNTAYNGSWVCPTLPEQTAIAKTLSDMDAEIAALEGKLSKARELKAGMMSVLLTGKIRLYRD
jgi:type I restriction enzyme, S subunit